MNINQVTNAPYLRTSRKFPEEQSQLIREIEKTYIDIANCVNFRAIGIFPTNKPVPNGEYWFIYGGRQQGFRQIYTFESLSTGANNIPHNINTTLIQTFSKIYGVFTDGTNWYPLPYVDVTSVTNQVALKVTPGNPLAPSPTYGNIVVTVGSGAPTIASGQIVLEWIVNV